MSPEEEGGIGVPLEARSIASSIKPAIMQHQDAWHG